MPRWIKQTFWAVVLGGALPVMTKAQPPAPPKPAPPGKAAPAPVEACPYRLATSYNPTVVNRPVPNSALSMPSFTLNCDIPNINVEGYVPYEECCFGGRRGCGEDCNQGCHGGLDSIFGSWRCRSNCVSGCNTGCNTGCNNKCNQCSTGCGSIFGGYRCQSSCNSCTSPCRQPLLQRCPKSCDNSCTSCSKPVSSSCCQSCNTGCGNFFGWRVGGNGCNNNCKGCGKDPCDHGCGSFLGFRRDRSCGCNDNHRDCCDRGQRSWYLWNGGWKKNVCEGCSSPCGSPCGHVTTPVPVTPVAPKTMPTANAKPVSYEEEIEQIGYWNVLDSWKQKKQRADERVNGCENCPPHGPTPKHTHPRASTLGCTGCSSLESEYVFIFGTCRQFFGEPTYCWLHGKQSHKDQDAR